MNRFNRKTGDAAVLAGPNAYSRLRSRCPKATANAKITEFLRSLFFLFRPLGSVSSSEKFI